MNGLDWAIMGVMLLSIWLAAVQGFFFEIFSLAGAILGFLLAAWGYQGIASWYLPHVKSAAVADLAGFLTIFFAIVLLAGIVARVVRRAISAVGLRWIDRFLGGAFGLVRGVVIITVAVMAIIAFVPDSPQLAGSQLAGYFQVAGSGATWLTPSLLRLKFREGVTRLRYVAPENRK